MNLRFPSEERLTKEPMDTQPYEIAQWFYVGHYGQLGPLTYDQMVELVQDGVIGRETYVWKNGMTQWEHALTVPDLRTSFAAETFMPPPPPPAFNPGSARPSLATAPSPAPMWSYGDYAIPRSDRNRIVAGVLQLIIPGTGRMYLGYAA